MSLELAAMRWLWLDKKCHYVLEERTPTYGMGQPDVLGVTKGRYLVEIEIKRSVSDFRADFKKPHRHRENREKYLPRQFYYLMPPELAEKLSGEIPEWAGFMTVDERQSIKVLKISPVNELSRKLTIKQCVKLARQMVAHTMGYALGNHSIITRYQNDCDTWFTDWVDAENGSWTI